MSLQELQWIEFERRGNVAVFEIRDWEQLFETEIDRAEQEYGEVASDPEITATVVVFDSVDTLDSEMQAHITEVWSGLAQAVDIDRAAYVADGITAMAVQSNVTAPGVEVDSFDDIEEAVSWAGA